MNNSCAFPALLLFCVLIPWLIAGMWWCIFSIASFCRQAWKQSSLQRAPQRPDRHQGNLLSFQKLSNSYLLSSWLPLASLPLLPPTPSFLLSSCFLHCGVGVRSRSGSQTRFSFQVSLLCTAFVHWLHLPPQSLFVLVASALNCVTPTLILTWSNDWMQKSSLDCLFILSLTNNWCGL